MNNEFYEFIRQCYSQNKPPMLIGTRDTDNTMLRKNAEYLSAHTFLPVDHDKIPVDKILLMGKGLLSRNTAIEIKKTILIILAHHSSREALFAIKTYLRDPDEDLRIFAEIALDECHMWQE